MLEERKSRIKAVTIVKSKEFIRELDAAKKTGVG